VPTRNEYREMAETCLGLADEIRDPGERKKLLEVAGGYMALARYVAERQDYGTAHRGPDHERHPDDA
jgi:hypothetical protein